MAPMINSSLLQKQFEDSWFAGRKVTVMGLGQFGGGLGVVKWLLGLGAKVHITDRASRADLSAPLAEVERELATGLVTLRLGEHSEADFTSCDLVVANAAIPQPWQNPLLESARKCSVPVTTEIRLSVERLNSNRVIGITGSAGKSTTAAMTARAIAATGRSVRLGGNIGGSLLGAASAAPSSWTVLELSSAQLWWLSSDSGAPGWSPWISALTNIAPNHVDWHGSLEHYIESKAQIRRNQPPQGCFHTWFASDNPEVSGRIAASSKCGQWWSSPSPAPARDLATIALSIPGDHQKRNARLALALVEAAAAIDGAPARLPDAESALKQFPGLEHRLQSIGERGGVRCFNDSKATTPEATLLAVAAFDDARRIHLIAGGYDKKIDLSSISQLAPKLAGLYAIGATAQTLCSNPSVINCGTLDAAVTAAFERTRPGDILLLSPGCASWDQFTNFEQRGRRFIELVGESVTAERC